MLIMPLGIKVSFDECFDFTPHHHSLGLEQWAFEKADPLMQVNGPENTPDRISHPPRGGPPQTRRTILFMESFLKKKEEF